MTFNSGQSTLFRTSGHPPSFSNPIVPSYSPCFCPLHCFCPVIYATPSSLYSTYPAITFSSLPPVATHLHCLHLQMPSLTLVHLQMPSLTSAPPASHALHY
ncbi:hypothetical protein AAC387_Pa05g1120 [Persea americana]